MGMGLPGMGGGGGGGMLGGLPGIGGAGNGGTLMGQNGINLSGIPFVGGMFPNPNEGAVRDAFGAAGQSYGNMRPQMAQGYQNMVSQFQNQMAPARQALSNMYGGQQGQSSDVTAAMAAQNPMPQMAPMSQGPSQQPSKGNDPMMDFANTVDPMGGLGSLGSSFSGLFGLGGGSGGPMAGLQGGMNGGGILGGLLGGGKGGLFGL